MGRIYTIKFSAVTVSAAQDLFELGPGDDNPTLLKALFLAQTSDVGDAAEEMLRIHVIRGNITSGSGGALGDVQALNPNDGGQERGSYEVNNTTLASGGTEALLHAEAFNIRTGLQLVWPPGLEPRCNEVLIVVRLMDAPADALTMTGTLYFEEL